MADSVRVEPRTYEVTIWPEDMAEGDESSDAASFCVQVRYRGHGKWALYCGMGDGRGLCLTSTGWNFKEPLLLSRGEALAMAESWAPRIRVSGMTATECLAWHRAGCPR